MSEYNLKKLPTAANLEGIEFRFNNEANENVEPLRPNSRVGTPEGSEPGTPGLPGLPGLPSFASLPPGASFFKPAPVPRAAVPQKVPSVVEAPPLPRHKTPAALRRLAALTASALGYEPNVKQLDYDDLKGTKIYQLYNSYVTEPNDQKLDSLKKMVKNVGYRSQNVVSTRRLAQEQYEGLLSNSAINVLGMNTPTMWQSPGKKTDKNINSQQRILEKVISALGGSTLSKGGQRRTRKTRKQRKLRKTRKYRHSRK